MFGFNGCTTFTLHIAANIPWTKFVTRYGFRCTVCTLRGSTVLTDIGQRVAFSRRAQYNPCCLCSQPFVPPGTPVESARFKLRACDGSRADNVLARLKITLVDQVRAQFRDHKAASVLEEVILMWTNKTKMMQSSVRVHTWYMPQVAFVLPQFLRSALAPTARR